MVVEGVIVEDGSMVEVGKEVDAIIIIDEEILVLVSYKISNPYGFLMNTL